jgi:predicted nucleotidyltransferase
MAYLTRVLMLSTYVLSMSTRTIADPVATKLFARLTRELLALLYADPERSLYLRELVRLTGASPGAVQREVGELTKARLLVRSRRGRQVFYQANRSTPAFAELRGLLEKTMGTADVLRAALAPLADRIEAAALFGSVVAGASGPTSDIDLLVIGSAEFAEVTDALAAAEARLGREINPMVYTRTEFRRRLSQGGHFATSVLRAPRMPLIGDLPDEPRNLARKRVAQAPRNVPPRDRGPSRGRRPRPR